MNRKLKLTLGVAGVAAFAWLSTARAQDGDDERALLGTWSVTVTPEATAVCGGGPSFPSPPAFTELETYNGGGGFLETNTQLNWNVAPLFPGTQANASDGLGTWRKEGRRGLVRFQKLIFSGGSHFATADFNASIDQPDPEHIAGTFTVQFDFLQGGSSICATGKLTGTPIRPQR